MSMTATSEDKEITLGTGKMLALFFSLVALCAVFFGMGFKVGKSAGMVTPTDFSSSTANGAQYPAAVKPAATQAAAPSLGFYKAVEQKDPNTQLSAPAAATTQPPESSATTAPPTSASASVPNDPGVPPATGFYVQVAAVSKQEDADALVEALKKKQYPAFSAPGSSDALFHVQVGPYTDIKQAEDMRSKLTNDGYNPILKK